MILPLRCSRIVPHHSSVSQLQNCARTLLAHLTRKTQSPIEAESPRWSKLESFQYRGGATSVEYEFAEISPKAFGLEYEARLVLSSSPRVPRCVRYSLLSRMARKTACPGGTSAIRAATSRF